MEKVIGNQWDQELALFFASPKYQELKRFWDEQYRDFVVYPPRNQIFKSFELTDFANVKVVILGQDPYYRKGQANGLAFSVSPGVALPKSLKNIFQELDDDLGISPSASGDLTKWAKQGVLLLNTVMTVRDGEPNSHARRGMEDLSDLAIKKLSERGQVVFILWGNAAQKKTTLIDEKKNIIIKSPHPSPLSSYRGFFGSRPYSKTNQSLVKFHKAPIDWRLD